jgi:hypothetical protein
MDMFWRRRKPSDLDHNKSDDTQTFTENPMVYLPSMNDKATYGLKRSVHDAILESSRSRLLAIENKTSLNISTNLSLERPAVAIKATAVLKL